MDWHNERWVKLYTRDNADWLALSWQAQGLFCLILRKVNRAGVIDLGRHGARGLATHFGGPSAWASIEPALGELLADGCVTIEGSTLAVPRFLEAQEATQSPVARKRTERERKRDGVTKRDQSSQNVTGSHEMSRDVTRGHAESRDVTNRLEQNRTEQTRERDARAHEPEPDDAPPRCPTVEPVAPAPPVASATDPADVLAKMRASSDGLIADPNVAGASELVAVKRTVEALLSRGVTLDTIVRSAKHLAHGHWTQKAKRTVITAGRLVEERQGRGSILSELLAESSGCSDCRPPVAKAAPRPRVINPPTQDTMTEEELREQQRVMREAILGLKAGGAAS